MTDNLYSVDGNIGSSLPVENRPRLVIVGGGFAGLHLARHLRKADLQIVMLDKNNFHTFQPLLYQVATAMLEPASMASSFRRIFKQQQNFHFRMVEVERIDPAARMVVTPAGCIGYDYLVIATGARTNFYGMADIGRHGFAMKDITEAIAIRQGIFSNLEQALMTEDPGERQRLMNIIIVGGGPTGIEIAGAIGELKKYILPYDYSELDMNNMQIFLIEAADRLLGGMSEEAGQRARRDLQEKFSVTIRLGTAIKSYDGRTAMTSDGSEIPSKMLIWVAGVTGNIPAGLTEAEIVAGGRIRTDLFNRVVGHDRIYALGDAAAIISEDTPKGDPMLAPVAIQQAENLAENLRSELDGSGSPLIPFIYKNKGIMATIGRNRAIVEGRKFFFGGFPAWLTWLFVHLLTLIGFRNKIIAFVNWAWNYVSYDRGIRLIIPRPKNRRENHRE